MQNAKAVVKELLNAPPDTVAFEEGQYSICVRQKIQRVLAEAETGELAGDEEVEAAFKKWLQKLFGPAQLLRT